jgi:hypothetical protein
MKLIKERNLEYWVNDKLHGEAKWWHDSGQLAEHSFWVNGQMVCDLMDNPVDDQEKFMITLETGAKWF